jgi:hypothetical protein
VSAVKAIRERGLVIGASETGKGYARRVAKEGEGSVLVKGGVSNVAAALLLGRVVCVTSIVPESFCRLLDSFCAFLLEGIWSESLFPVPTINENFWGVDCCFLPQGCDRGPRDGQACRGI